MPLVSHMKIKRGMSISALARQMEQVKVLGPGRFGKAAKILGEMFSDDDYCNFISLAGPIIPGGLRTLVTDLVDQKLIDGVVTTGANVTHDMLEGLGHRHIVGSERLDDSALKRKGLSRIYDLLVKQKAIVDLEKTAHGMLNRIPEQKRRNIASYELLWEFGRQLKDRNSLLKTAEKRGVPIFCPGIFDSMLGLDLWTYSQLNQLVINPFKDFSKLVDMTFEAKLVGAVILGGGMPKHHVLVANSYRGGLDAAIQITLDRPEGGGASGAPLEEAISWGKIRRQDKLVTITGDAITTFPILALAAMEIAKT
ncbi:MAG TPA: deoxyhypusine synthase family protein [Candidatus Bathyarchaeia archaeon]|nr:deoxyhypusine synthase family protein [Candidatus Bathyarchaeia archaeon]